MPSNLNKEDVLQILNATDSEIINYMSQTVQYRENNLITYADDTNRIRGLGRIP